jgi:hypothetical protein
VPELGEADLHALAGVAGVHVEFDFGRGMVGRVFRADDAEVLSDDFGVAVGFLDFGNEIKDAGHGSGRNGDDTGGQRRRGESRQDHGTDALSVEQQIDGFGGRLAERAGGGEPLAEHVDDVARIGHGLRHFGGVEAERGGVAGDFGAIIFVPRRLIAEPTWIPTLSFHFFPFCFFVLCLCARKWTRVVENSGVVENGRIIVIGHGFSGLRLVRWKIHRNTLILAKKDLIPAKQPCPIALETGLPRLETVFPPKGTCPFWNGTVLLRQETCPFCPETVPPRMGQTHNASGDVSRAKRDSASAKGDASPTEWDVSPTAPSLSPTEWDKAGGEESGGRLTEARGGGSEVRARAAEPRDDETQSGCWEEVEVRCNPA